MSNDYTGDNSGDAFRLQMKEDDGFPDVKGVKTIIVSDGSLSDLGDGTVQLNTGGGGGGGTPGGMNTQVQYNKNGNFAGSPGFTYDEVGQNVTIANNLDIGGKLTVAGLIDPTGLELVPQSSNPGGVAANTLWLDSNNSDKLKQGATNIIQAGDPVSDLVNDAGYIASADAPIQSVFGRTGDIVATSGDYNSDEVTEGATNLYYTDARVSSVVSSTNINDLADIDITSIADGEVLIYDAVSGNWENGAIPSAPVSSVFGRTGAVSAQSGDYTTNQVTEGTNLYFTAARADAQIAAASISDLSDVDTPTPSNGEVLTYNGGIWGSAAVPSAPVDSVNGEVGVVVLDTDDISEGASNLYYTDVRVQGVISSTNINDLSDISITGVANGEALIYNSVSGNWENATLPSAPVTSVNTQTGAVVLDTDDVSEGLTNLYYTSARFDTDFATKNTDDLTEGATNLYYTDAKVETVISSTNINDLADINITTVADNQVLQYDSASGQWKNETLASGGSPSTGSANQFNVADGSGGWDSAAVYYHTTGSGGIKIGNSGLPNYAISAQTSGSQTFIGRFVTQASQSKLAFLSSGSNTSAVAFGAATNQALIVSNQTDYLFPLSDGSNGDVLTTDGSGNLSFTTPSSSPVDSVNGQTGVVVLDTDDVSEGLTNLYYTEARFDASLAGKTTTDLAEGTNLYFTDARADARIAAANIGDLNDVTITSIANNEVLIYNSTSGEWENGAIPSAPVSSVNTQTGAVVLDTDDISEGATNLYFTNARASAAAPVQSVNGATGAVSLSTSDISEGSNLYYTNARASSAADTQIAAADIQDLSNVVITTPASGEILEYNGTNWVNASNTDGTVTSVATSAPLTGGTITSTGTIGISQSDTTTDGFLSSTDWNTFNNKFGSGDDISVGSITTSAVTSAITYADASGVLSAVTIGSGLTFSGGTLASTDAGGTVTSVAASGGTTGMTFTGSPITTSGTLTLGGTLSLANGGTGSTTASDARTALGVAIGSDVQAYDADLTAIAGLSSADGNFIVGSATGWVAESGATARTSLGLGSAATADTGDFATAAQGVLADSATQPGDNISTLTNDSGYTTNTGTVTSVATGTGLTGGTITGSGTISLANTAVTAGSYTLADITVDAQGRITAASNGTAPSAPVDSVNGQTGVVVLDTDDVSEGLTNLYFTSSRFDTDFGTKDTDDLSEGLTNLYYTEARFDASLSGKTTSDLAEGSNLYFTNARADARIAAANINDLNDVVITTVADNQALLYDSATSQWKNEALPSAPVDSVNGQTGAVSLASTDLTDTATLVRNGDNVSVLNNDAGYTTNAGTVTSITASAPLTGGTITTSGSVGINQATTSTDGYLSSTDWNTFNNKTSNTGTVTSVATGTGLTGGTITSTGTISLANTTVTAGSYTLADITVDAQGRITAASNGSAPPAPVDSVNGQTGVVSLASTDLTDTATLVRQGDNVSVLANDANYLQTVAVDGVTITGDGTPANPLVAAGGGGGGISIGDAVGSGTAGSVLFVDASTNLGQDNANLYWDNSNDRLGIGTATPAESLDVRGNVVIQDPSSTGTTDHLLEVKSGSSSTPDNARILVSADTDAKLPLIHLRDIEANGGTFSTHYSAYMGLDRATPIVTGSAQNDLLIANGNFNKDIHLCTNNTGNGSQAQARLTIVGSDGDVGIGTTSPAAKLHVSGTIRQTNSTNAVLVSDGNGDIGSASNLQDVAYLQTVATDPATITGDGTVGNPLVGQFVGNVLLPAAPPTPVPALPDWEQPAPLTPVGWIEVNVGGTPYYLPAYQ